VPKLPLTIAPGQIAEIEAALYASIQDVGKPLSGQILLYLDVPSPPVVLAFSVGNVLEPTDERTVKH
jgi:hypothetical protein